MRVLVSHLSFAYDRPVLHDVSFEANGGEFLSVLGPNGSGKSTLLRLLARILLPEKGSITLGDRPLSLFERNQLARIIGYVPQEMNVFFPFTVMEVVLMGRTPYVGKWGFENRDDIQQAEAMMELTDISHLAGKIITAISGGERQRVLIARALAQRPKVLLLDEPNAHLDLSHQIDVFRILQRQQREQGITIISVSHDLNLAAAFSTSVLLLGSNSPEAGNTVVAAGTPEKVLTSELIKTVFHTDVHVARPGSGEPVRISLSLESLRDGKRNVP
jgi:iron complex transport system ATP-binding protein